MIAMLFGLLVFILGATPETFNLDRSPVMGFVQIAVFLLGLGMICLGGYITLSTLWLGREKTIAADIGLRLISTGYVISVASGMADIFGFGTHSLPRTAYFGPMQVIGVMAGQVIIITGFILMIPRRRDLEQKPEL
jgi:hypothetical protein